MSITRLLLWGQLYGVCTDGIQKISRMRRDDEHVVIRRKVRFQPHDRSEIQMVGRFV